ncbi:MAG: hypothetical protein LBM77_05365 [Spirochaetaceae bacterium]|jgi:hypothetical protein|nr:hypothetical protein [Spirochaetaceae bacterium]
MTQTQRKKKFNITGPCIRGRDYMVDTSAKIETIVHDYIEEGDYFVINRGRQYGKTTTLELLYQRLKDTHIVLDFSFEGVGTDMFKDEYTFYEGLRLLFFDKLLDQGSDYTSVFENETPEKYPNRDFRKRIEELCGTSPKPVILFIDEIDVAPDFDAFFNFLGMLRDKFIERSKRNTPTFQSVIFAGVTDLQKLKSRIRPESEHTIRSPWNIAVPFTVDMRFAPPEIVTMLADYEADRISEGNPTGMDQMAIAERIYYYTSGYPFMVSAICKAIDETGKPWTIEAVDETAKNFVAERNTLFGSLVANLQRDSEFASVAKNLVLDGVIINNNGNNPSIERGLILNIFTEDEHQNVTVSNKVYETRIANYFIAQMLTKPNWMSEKSSEAQSHFIENGELNLKFILQRFNVFMKSEYRDRDSKFIEREARLVFLAFLKPIINGQGNYAIEPETRNFQRMDIVVFFQGKEYVLELKIWHGEKHNDNAINQLIEYLKTRDTKEGYLLSFASNKTSPKESQVIEQDGYTIYEEVVAYNEND